MVSFDFHRVAGQEKPNCQIDKQNGEPQNGEPLVDSPNKAIEDSNGLEASPTDVTTDDILAEVAPEADLIDNKPDEVDLAPDLSVASEERNSEAAQVPCSKEPDSSKAGGKRKLQMQGKWKGVDPVLFFRDEVIINSIKTFYGIDESFTLVGHLVTRNLDNNHVKRIYYVSKSVKDVLQLNFSVGQPLKIASVGLKMFVSISICKLDFS